MLAYLVQGEARPDRNPLLVAHGLYGSARNWGAISRNLGKSRQVVAVDMRNHGNSPWFETNSYPDMASDLKEIIDVVGGKVDVLGHSMGGKAAMALSLEAPELVDRLIVADIAPVVYNHSQSMYIDAMRAIRLDAVALRSDADKQMRDTVADPATRAFLLQSLDIKNQKWRLNLDTLEKEMPKIMGFPEYNSQFTKPTLFVYGGASDYVTTEQHPRIQALFPMVAFEEIPGAGHWLHAEKPREFEALIEQFLA